MSGPYWNPIAQLELADSPSPATLQCARIMPAHLNARCWAVIPESTAAEAMDLARQLANTPPTMVKQQQLTDLARLCLCQERHAGHVDITVKSWVRVVDEAALKFREEGHDVTGSDSCIENAEEEKMEHVSGDEGEHDSASEGERKNEINSETQSESQAEKGGESEGQQGEQGQHEDTSEVQAPDLSAYVVVDRRRWEMLEREYTLCHELLSYSDTDPDDTESADTTVNTSHTSSDSANDYIRYDSLPRRVVQHILAAADNEVVLVRTVSNLKGQLHWANDHIKILQTLLQQAAQREEALHEDVHAAAYQITLARQNEQARLASVTQTLQQARQEQEALRGRVEVAEQGMKATHLGLTKAQAEVGRLIKEDERTRAQLHEANDRAKEVLALMDAERDRTMELEQIRCKLNKRIVFLEAQQADGEQQGNQTGESSKPFPSLEQQLADVTTTSERDIHAMQRRNQTLRKIHTDLLDRIAAIRLVGQRHERELADTAADLQAIHRVDENRIDRLRQCVAQYQNKYQSSVAQEQQTQSVLRCAQQAADPLRSCNEHLRREIARLEGRIEELSEEQAAEKSRGWRGRFKAWARRKTEDFMASSQADRDASEAFPDMDGQRPTVSARPFPSLF